MLRVGTSIAVAFAACAAHAAGTLLPDGASFNVGSGDQTQIYGLAAHWNSLCACEAAASAGFTVRMEAQIDYWKGTQTPSDHRSDWYASVTPSLRWTAAATALGAVFAEIGIGGGFLSDTHVNVDRHFATSFQFNEQGSLGFAFGPHRRYEFAAFARHVSNGDIKKADNDGITYFGGSLRAYFE